MDATTTLMDQEVTNQMAAETARAAGETATLRCGPLRAACPPGLHVHDEPGAGMGEGIQIDGQGAEPALDARRKPEVCAPLSDTELINLCHELKRQKSARDFAEQRVRQLTDQVLGEYDRRGIKRFFTILPELRADRRRKIDWLAPVDAFLRLCGRRKLPRKATHDCVVRHVDAKRARALLGEPDFLKIAQPTPSGEWITFQPIKNGTVGAAE